MSKRNPWVILLGILLLAAFVFTTVLVRAAPIHRSNSSDIPPEVEEQVRARLGLERPTTGLARRLGFVRRVDVDPASELQELQVLESQEDDQAQATQESRLVIYTVDTSLIVDDVEQALADVEELTARLDGYVTSSSTSTYEDNVRATIVIRVPSAQLDTVRAELRALALEVRNETRSGEDVTEEYVDLNARIQILQAAEQELLELYETRQASGEISDILEVYEELVGFREEIESLTGRMQYLEQSAALATVTIELIPDELAHPIEIGWGPQGAARSAFQSLVRAFQLLADSIIWFLIYTLPQLLLVVVLVYLLWRWVGRRIYERIRAAVAQWSARRTGGEAA